ncbi:unnamed protein product [Phytomonas sp. EM1]|nr:unnamed protein product [Phytomonas sp. EM1]|eukprot:CCW64524.1 unnamed protein product [Phytomonas sp. isolate EM1]
MGMEHYVKVRDLGGNSGAFLAIDRHTPGKQVVIKRLADGAQGMEELKASLSVQHPNIIHFLESFVYDGNLYVVLRHEAGGDMDNLLTRLLQLHKLPTTHTLLMWYTQLLEALAHCHAQRVIHRDIKPSNIFVSEDTKTLYLGDFGSAKELTSSNLTSTFVGSPLWISPEVLQGKSYSFSSDIWSLGCVFYEMACLHRPFTGSCFARLVNEITTGSLAPMPDEMPPIIKEVITRMLVLAPSERPTAAEMLVVVKSALKAEREMQKSSSSAPPRMPRLSPRNLQLMSPRQGVQEPAPKVAKPHSVLSPKIPYSVVKNRSQSKARGNFSRYMTTSALSRSQERVDAPPVTDVTVKFRSPDDQASAMREREHYVAMPAAVSPARHTPHPSPIRVRSAEPFQPSRDVWTPPDTVNLHMGGSGKAGGRSTTPNDSSEGLRSGRNQRAAMVHPPQIGQGAGARGVEARIALKKEQLAESSERSSGHHWMSPVLLVIPSSNKARIGPPRRKKSQAKKHVVPASGIISSRSHRSASGLAAATAAAAVPLCPPDALSIGTDKTPKKNRDLIKGHKCPYTRQAPITTPINEHLVAQLPIEVLGTATPPLRQHTNEKAEPSMPAKMLACQRSGQPPFVSPEGSGVREKHGIVSASAESQGDAPRIQVQPPPVARRAQAAAERNKQHPVPHDQNVIPQPPRLQSSPSLPAQAERATRAHEVVRSVRQPQPTVSTVDARNTSSELQRKLWLLELNHNVTDIENYLCRFREHDQHVLHANGAATGEAKPLQHMERCESRSAKPSFLRQASLLSVMERAQSPPPKGACSGNPSSKPDRSPLSKPNKSTALREEARRIAKEKREAQRAKLKELIREGRAKAFEGKAVNRKKLNVEIKIPHQSGSKGNKLGCRANRLEAV